MSEITRVVIPLDSPSEEAWGTALAYADAIGEKAGATDVILLTHTKHQMDHTSLSRFIGHRAMRTLAKARSL